MAMFTVRVELHGATDGDYDTLHDAMEAEGFGRTVVSNAGDEYRLPSAEYSLAGDFTVQKVLAMAKNAAAKVRLNRSILVNEVTSRLWLGLNRT
jgi:hypothetical protein